MKPLKINLLIGFWHEEPSTVYSSTYGKHLKKLQADKKRLQKELRRQALNPDLSKLTVENYEKRLGSRRDPIFGEPCLNNNRGCNEPGESVEDVDRFSLPSLLTLATKYTKPVLLTKRNVFTVHRGQTPIFSPGQIYRAKDCALLLTTYQKIKNTKNLPNEQPAYTISVDSSVQKKLIYNKGLTKKKTSQNKYTGFGNLIQQKELIEQNRTSIVNQPTINTVPNIQQVTIQPAGHFRDNAKKNKAKRLGRFFYSSLTNTDLTNLEYYYFYNAKKNQFTYTNVDYAGPLEAMQHYVQTVHKAKVKPRQRNRRKVFHDPSVFDGGTDEGIDFETDYVVEIKRKQKMTDDDGGAVMLNLRQEGFRKIIKNLEPLSIFPPLTTVYPSKFFINNPDITPHAAYKQYKHKKGKAYAEAKKRGRKKLEKIYRKTFKEIKQAQTQIRSLPPHLIPITAQSKKIHEFIKPHSIEQILTLGTVKYEQEITRPYFLNPGEIYLENYIKDAFAARNYLDSAPDEYSYGRGLAEYENWPPAYAYRYHCTTIHRGEQLSAEKLEYFSTYTEDPDFENYTYDRVQYYRFLYMK